MMRKGEGAGLTIEQATMVSFLRSMPYYVFILSVSKESIVLFHEM